MRWRLRCLGDEKDGWGAEYNRGFGASGKVLA